MVTGGRGAAWSDAHIGRAKLRARTRRIVLVNIVTMRGIVIVVSSVPEIYRRCAMFQISSV